MSSKQKVVVGLLGVLLITILVVAYFSYRLVRNSLPETKGQIVVEGLYSEVKVYRDEYGVPHIFATNDDDLFFAMGYITAQDRLWQMDLTRRVAEGRLSEIFGERTIESDRFLRTIGFRRVAQKIFKNISPESKRILEAYTRGVNAFLKDNHNRLPIEFTLLKYQPEEWKPQHSIAYERVMGWTLCMAWKVDLLLGALVEKLGVDKARQVFPGYPTSAPTIIPPEYKKFALLQTHLSEANRVIKNLLGMRGTHLGSNSWVVSGEKSVTGKPLLANDPHLGLGAPSVWYEIHLKSPAIDVYGVSLPGIPGIVIGHNRFIAWGLTNTMADDADFYMEKINPQNPDQYQYLGKWENMTIETENIPVKGREAEKFEVRLTRHGPVISDVHDVTKNGDQVVTLRWTGHQVSDEVLAFSKILRARNWNEFVDGLRHYKVPSQNIVYADVHGNIGYWCAGAIPIRKTGKGILPYSGWTDAGKWQDYIPFEKLPHLFNPPEQFIATANNKTVGDWYPYHISNLWEPPSRIERIREMLAEKDKFSIDDFKRMQLDYLSPHARSVVPHILQNIKEDDLKDELQNFCYKSLQYWNYEEKADEVAPAIFNVFYLQFLKNIYRDEMGEKLYRNFIDLPNVPVRTTDQLLARGHSVWFDNVMTPDKVETLKDIILASFVGAVEFLKQERGTQVADWQWGQLHTITFEHPLGAQKPLNWIFNIGPYPIGGSGTTVNNGEFPFTNPYHNILGPSTRQIVDLSDLENSLSVITTGQSGQPFDKHYKDQTPLWLKGRYHPAIMDSSKIVTSKWDVLTLKGKN